jgi:hypothetical protein
MRKRTGIAVVVAALLVATVAPTVTTNRQVAQASALDGRAVARTLDAILPVAARVRAGRPAFLTELQRLRLAKVACTVNKAHDFVHEYHVDRLVWELDVPGAYRYQDSVLTLSQQIHEYKDDAGAVYELGSELYCDTVDARLEQGS